MVSDLETAVSIRPTIGSGAKAHRLFRYAMARACALDDAAVRRATLISAEYPIVFSVAYTEIQANATKHDLASTRRSVEDDKERARRAARSFVARRTGTDLYASLQPRPAPFASSRISGAAGSAGVLRGRDEDDEATGEGHLLKPKGEAH